MIIVSSDIVARKPHSIALSFDKKLNKSEI